MMGFRSDLFTTLCAKLGIDTRYSAPFHFISHGAVERANRTIESLIKKHVLQNPTDWDKSLPVLLYAIRDVPNASTKISPNEMVFGRKPRGLLDVARQTWTKGDPDSKKLKMSTVQYMEKLNEKLEMVHKIARENITHAQERTKHQYDKAAKQHELLPEKKL